MPRGGNRSSSWWLLHGKLNTRRRQGERRQRGPVLMVQRSRLHVQEHPRSGFAPKSSCTHEQDHEEALGGGSSAPRCRKGQASGLWAGKQLVMRNKTSKAHHGTSLAQILSRNSPPCSLFGFMQCQTWLLPLSDPERRVRKLRVGK